MTICVRADDASQITQPGLSAKLVSIAVIKAYQICREVDLISLMQWEASSWPKIALKVHSDKEVREIALKAKEQGLSHYILERQVSKQKTVVDDLGK